MTRAIRSASLLLSFFTALVSLSSCAEPPSCSDSEKLKISQISSASDRALAHGNINHYRSLQHQLHNQISDSCNSFLDQLIPTRARCTSSEKGLVLDSVRNINSAAWQGDMESLFNQALGLESKVSQSCWLAFNHYQDPGIKNSCTITELDYMASHTSTFLQAMKAIYRASFSGEFAQAITLTQRIATINQEMLSNLSSACANTVASYQQKQNQQNGNANRQSASSSLPGVLDHGNGTFSAPGIGACTPSGCMAY